jgi:hypothetical protein
VVSMARTTPPKEGKVETSLAEPPPPHGSGIGDSIEK